MTEERDTLRQQFIRAIEATDVGGRAYYKTCIGHMVGPDRYKRCPDLMPVKTDKRQCPFCEYDDDIAVHGRIWKDVVGDDERKQSHLDTFNAMHKRAVCDWQRWLISQCLLPAVGILAAREIERIIRGEIA